jgi:hypothetical protein
MVAAVASLPPATQLPSLRRILAKIHAKELPGYETRGMLLDWENEADDLIKSLLEHARAVKAGKPIKSYVTSADDMSDMILQLFGQ